MKSIKDAQSSLVNDTCAECGSYVDIGAVVEEGDTKLQLNLAGANAKAEAGMLAEQAQQRFADAVVELQEQEHSVQLSIVFGCSAEKMIFQLQHNLP
ncbi:YfcZ/YiiS family protein [Shewanella sp. C32]|uniref:YfcZ/YiiS family protein n=1 Tax=Shewanella electrica TaxID=515560 RepID=A0ABT2FQQ3_9GAMM|nr:DUF406 family protein [Shewanella electrica]MCH1927041.1 YfcZ/YiiS family protein [Shewanella electrica]MCS4558650.1 YfcZ/YiiS family protein [Shewanella electrica]